MHFEAMSGFHKVTVMDEIDWEDDQFDNRGKKMTLTNGLEDLFILW